MLFIITGEELLQSMRASMILQQNAGQGEHIFQDSEMCANRKLIFYVAIYDVSMHTGYHSREQTGFGDSVEE